MEDFKAQFEAIFMRIIAFIDEILEKFINELKNEVN